MMSQESLRLVSWLRRSYVHPSYATLVPCRSILIHVPTHFLSIAQHFVCTRQCLLWHQAGILVGHTPEIWPTYHVHYSMKAMRTEEINTSEICDLMCIPRAFYIGHFHICVTVWVFILCPRVFHISWEVIYFDLGYPKSLTSLVMACDCVSCASKARGNNHGELASC